MKYRDEEGNLWYVTEPMTGCGIWQAGFFKDGDFCCVSTFAAEDAAEKWLAETASRCGLRPLEEEGGRQ